MKKKLILIISLIFITVIAFFVKEKFNVTKDSDIPLVTKKETRLLTMNLEQTAGAGDYKTVTQSEWPTDGYKFNSELSRCENGSELSWDNTKKTIIVSGNTSDKCYVYFDIYQPHLAEYVISQYTGTQGENGIYYHNSSLTNGADDNSYRYAGANPNNYVCFGSNATTCPEDNLYRIVGVINNKVKLVKASKAGTAMLGTDGAYHTNAYERYLWTTLYKCPSTTAYVNDNYNKVVFMANKNELAAPMPDAGCNKWDYSELNTINLNKNFLQQFSKKYINFISNTLWQNNSKETKIGLISYQDYQYAFSYIYWDLNYSGEYRINNWLYDNQIYCSHTISQGTSECRTYIIPNDDFYSADFGVDIGKGGKLIDFINHCLCSVFPTFFLNSDVTYKSGTGTSSDPIIIGD